MELPSCRTQDNFGTRKVCRGCRAPRPANSPNKGGKGGGKGDHGGNSGKGGKARKAGRDNSDKKLLEEHSKTIAELQQKLALSGSASFPSSVGETAETKPVAEISPFAQRKRDRAEAKVQAWAALPEEEYELEVETIPHFFRKQVEKIREQNARANHVEGADPALLQGDALVTAWNKIQNEERAA